MSSCTCGQLTHDAGCLVTLLRQPMRVVMVGRKGGTAKSAGIGAYKTEHEAEIARDAAKAALQCTPMHDLEVWIEDEP